MALDQNYNWGKKNSIDKSWHSISYLLINCFLLGAPAPWGQNDRWPEINELKPESEKLSSARQQK